MNESKPPRVLLTAFDTYRDGTSFYAENASRLALEHLKLQPPRGVMLETRVFPVDFQSIRRRIEKDMRRGFDFVILTGQAPSSTILRLEMIAKNLGVDPNGSMAPFNLAADGPLNIASTIDWKKIVATIQLMGEELALSLDAGTFLCNAALYFAILSARRFWEAGAGESLTRVGFVHVPLAANMPTERTARVLGELIEIAALTGNVTVAKVAE